MLSAPRSRQKWRARWRARMQRQQRRANRRARMRRQLLPLHPPQSPFFPSGSHSFQAGGRAPTPTTPPFVTRKQISNNVSARSQPPKTFVVKFATWSSVPSSVLSPLKHSRVVEEAVELAAAPPAMPALPAPPSPLRISKRRSSQVAGGR